ncbi:MAG: TMEM175 family protein [Pyrinomonadaceae bacterium]
MKTGRMEAFSDGVLAIIITIMVLELSVPHETTWRALLPVIPIFLSYVLSFIYIGIYWNNHHHMLNATKNVTGGILWANLHLLFWLSLFPFATGWMGENNFATIPTAFYGIVLLGAAFAYLLLQNAIICAEGEKSDLKRAVGRDLKGKISVGCYILGIAGSFVNNWLGVFFYTVVAIIWLVPDKRIERLVRTDGD